MTNTAAAAALANTLALVAVGDAAHAAARRGREVVYAAIAARRAAVVAVDKYDGDDDAVEAGLVARLADARAAVDAAEAACAPLEAAERTAGAAAVKASVSFFAELVEAAVAAGTRPAAGTFDLLTGGHCHRPTHAACAGAWYTLDGGVYHGKIRRENNPAALDVLGAPDDHALGASWGEYQGGRFCGTVWKRL